MLYLYEVSDVYTSYDINSATDSQGHHPVVELESLLENRNRHN